MKQHNTSTPIDYKIVYKMFFDDYVDAEKVIQTRLNKINREFYDNSIDEINHIYIDDFDIQKLLNGYFTTKKYNQYFELI